MKDESVKAISYQCCFCAQMVQPDQIDPLQLIVLERADWNSNSAEHPTQSLWCHTGCLAERLHAGVPFLKHDERMEDLDADV